MAEYISFQPSDFFNNVAYTGTGAIQTISGVGFEPNFTWIKDRDVAKWHCLVDTVRGYDEYLYSNYDGAEANFTDRLTAWNSDGFVLGAGVETNTNTSNLVAWNWKAGTTSGITGGTITPSSYSINTTSGCGIYAYAGTGSAGTIAHGLGVAPKFMTIKCLSAASTDWVTWISPMAVNEYMYLNGVAIKTSSTAFMNSVLPSSTLINLGDAANVNGSGKTFIAYVFAEKKGYSKFGSYEGNGDDDGQFIYTGFSPAYVFVKKTNGTANWIQSGSGISFNGEGTNESNVLRPDTGDDESNEYGLLRFSNGFGFKGTDSSSSTVNGSGDTYAYVAFAEFPIVSSNDVPAVAQ